MKASAIVVLSSLYLGACAGDSKPALDRDVPPPSSSTETAIELLDPPSGPGSMAPRLTLGNEGVLLTWLQPVADSERREFRLMTSELSQGTGLTWGVPQPIVQSDALFANWADLPAAVEGPGDVRFAHWLEKLGEGTYDYGVQLARSIDGGDSWERIGLLHDDASLSEHGFVSYAPTEGGVQAFWLDGRAMAKAPHGEGEHAEHPVASMQLRTTRLDEHAGPPPSILLDERVCECCQTDAALTASGPIVVYRDRDASEIRDISVVRATEDGWTEPSTLHADGWQIHGCPVNGPAVDADCDRVAVAWFTAAEEVPRVLVAFSTDAGASFGAPIEIDGDQPAGRVDVALAATGGTEPSAYVSWLGTAGEDAVIRLRRVALSGELGNVHRIAATTAERSSGVPRMVRHGDRLILTWVEDGEPSRVRIGMVSSRPAT